MGDSVSRYALNVTLYRLKRDRAFRERFLADRAAALDAMDLTPEEREAFVRWDVRKLDELGGFLHLLLSIPRLGGH